jgi:magnesium-dependent phosphatase 1
LENTTILEHLDYLEIYPGSKIKHFKSLSERSGIVCHEMLFFDDESRNKEVTKLGVHFVKVDTRSGITPFQFENALHTYAANSGVKQSSVIDFFSKQ